MRFRTLIARTLDRLQWQRGKWPSERTVHKCARVATVGLGVVWCAVAATASADDPPAAPPPPVLAEPPPPLPPPPAPAPAPAPTPAPAPAPTPAPPVAPAPAPAPVVAPKPVVAPVITPVAKPDAKPLLPASVIKPVKIRRFIEGELANVGALGLVPWQNRFGLTAGIERIGEVYYATLTPGINYSTELGERALSIGVGIPVRLELNDTRPGKGFNQVGQLRKEDWDEGQDYAQLIRNITFGSKEDRIYFDVNAFKASSLGHGTIMKRYNPNLNLNSRQVSAEFDGFTDYGGGEFFVNNITRPNLMGGLFFLKPLSLVDRDSYVMRSFSVGATAVADLDAPLHNSLDFDDVDKDGLREHEYLIDQKSFKPQYVSSRVVSFGLDTEVKLVDTKTTDWKTYVDYSFLASGLPVNKDDPLWNTAPTKPGIKGVMSSGLAWGHLLRLNLGEDPVHALRLRAEIRRYDQNYLPSYFDTMYEIQRVQYRLGDRILDQNGTKLQQILGRDPKANGGAKVYGLYFEASWKIADYFAMALATEVNDSTPDNNLFVHIEVPQVKNIQFLATFHRRSAKTPGALFAGEFTTRDIFIIKGRYRVFDFFHVNIEALTPFGIGPDSFFANTVDVNLNAEFGFAYGSAKK